MAYIYHINETGYGGVYPRINIAEHSDEYYVRPRRVSHLIRQGSYPCHNDLFEHFLDTDDLVGHRHASYLTVLDSFCSS